MRQSDRKAWGILSGLRAQRQVLCADLRRGIEDENDPRHRRVFRRIHRRFLGREEGEKDVTTHPAEVVWETATDLLGRGRRGGEGNDDDVAVEPWVASFFQGTRRKGIEEECAHDKKDTFWNYVRQNVGQVMVKISHHVRFLIKKNRCTSNGFFDFVHTFSFFFVCAKKRLGQVPA